MPRASKINHPLKQLRNALGQGYTQPKIAKIIGVSAVTVKRIENGYGLNLNQNHLLILANRFGVDPASLKRSNGVARDIWGRAYSQDSFKQWKDGQRDIPSRSLVKIGELYGRRIAALLLAGKESKSTFQILLGLQNWFLEAYAIKGVSKDYNTALHALTKEPVKKRIEFGELKKNPAMMADLRWPKTFNPPSTMPVKITGERFLTFFPPRITHGGQVIFETANRHYAVAVECCGKKWEAQFDEAAGISFGGGCS